MKDSNPWENILMSILFATSCAVQMTSQMTPGQMVFGRDVILHATHVALHANYSCDP